MYDAAHARNRRCTAPLALLIALVGAPAGEWRSARAADFDALMHASPGRSRRASSRDPNWRDGNRDWREIAPGETITLADLAGPGVIRHIWFTVNARDLQYPRSLVLRMYWDGDETPAVESPLGDFFAVGHGLRREVDSAAVAITSEGRAYNCYWSMPFRKRARITVTNDSPDRPVPKFYYYIDYDTVESWPDDVLYFHAQYRQEWPASPGDYLVCEAEGRGHYVGTVLSVQLRTRGWFGEGDDRFYIDGDVEPGLHGTGSEDYFCDAWGFREYMRPFYGVVLMEGFEFGDRLTVYRWHLADPIRFERSLRFVMEHKGSAYDEQGNAAGGHSERPDLFSSVAFWYQDRTAHRFARVPPLAERLPPTRRIELEGSVDDVRIASGEAKVTLQKGDMFSGGGQLLVSAAGEGTSVVVPFTLDEPLSGAGRLVLTTSISAGVWKAYLDGEIIPTLRHEDLYDKYYTPTDFNAGYVELAAGPHELRFECLGKRAASRAHQVGIDVFKVEHVTRHRVTTTQSVP
jgi:hypothetical protein